MKHGIQLHACPIKVLNNEFPTPADKANECVSIFAQNSQSEGLSLKDQQHSATEESATMYKDPLSDNISINSVITLREVSDATVMTSLSIWEKTHPIPQQKISRCLSRKQTGSTVGNKQVPQ